MSLVCSPVSHVIFDVDGLLLDTERLYTEATDRIVAQYGKQFTWEIKVQLMGKRMDEAAACIIERLDLPISAEEYIEQSQLLWKQLFPTAQLLPGVERLVEHLHRHAVPMAVASGMGQEAFQLKTTRHSALFSRFTHAVLASSDADVKRGKPAPDVFLVCSSRFSPPPATAGQVLVFEDAPGGVQAARAAGMQCVMVPDPRVDRQLTEGATLVLPTLQDFQPQLFGLPPYDC